MSIASMASLVLDDPPPPPPPPIPHPSRQHPRPPDDSIARTRTYSQPPSPNGFALPTPDASRPTSPRASDVKPTRIPVAFRTRTTSSSGHSIAHTRNANNHRPHQLPTPDTSQEHYRAKPVEHTASIRSQPSSIMNEPPPFSTSSITYSARSRAHEPVPRDSRPSTDSEERPFEHWYRGDVHRNGGVGELRVAKHVEMLQIANYGHNLRKPRGSSAWLDSSRGRKRADSVGADTRESLYLDDDPAKDASMVLDESPPTDIEAGPDDDPESFYDAYASVDSQPDPDDTIHSRFTASPPLATVSPSRSQTPTNPRTTPDDNATPRLAPREQPLHSGAPLRTSAESTTPAPSTTRSRAQTVSRTTSPASQSSDQSNTKRRAKSPAASSPASTPKKARLKAKTPPPTSRKADPRNSVAVYPTPEGNVVDAIPTWTQPVPKSGNWDEVVLPVVARKKGLDGQYEQADGTPKPRSSESPVKPAPGTFGFDYTKYRPPRPNQDGEEIQMDDFCQSPEQDPLPEQDPTPAPAPPPPPAEPSPKPKSRPKPRPIRVEEPDPRETAARPPESPAPFSQYRVEVPTINVTRPSTEVAEHRPELDDADVGGGCCKCIIM